jgi:hypothetical protein
MTIDQSTGELARPAPASAAAMLLNGAGTMTAAGRAEMARGVAEVLAQVQVAQAIPRQLDSTMDRVRISCARYSFAERAFYSYKRGGKTITGPSVKLIRELAAAFGNFQYGLVEVDRDEARGFSMMMAFAWDVQTNTRNSSTFMVRAVRDLAPEEGSTERRKVALFDERDIYENNTNMGARRVREAIKATMPAWLIDEASDLCLATIKRGPLDADGKATPLPVRMANAVEKFAAEFGVRKDQLEKFIGVPFDKWRDRDLARLLIIYRSIDIGDLRVDEVFAEEVGDDQLAAQAAARAPQAGNGAEDAIMADQGGPLSDRTKQQIETQFALVGWISAGNEARRRTVTGWLGARLPQGTVTEWGQLTEAQGLAALAALTEIMADADGRRQAVGKAYTEARAAAKTGTKPPPETEARPAPASAGAAAADPEGETGPPVNPVAALGSRLADIPGLAGGGEQAKARRAVVAGVLVTGHYYEFPGGAITAEQATTALANLDALTARAGGTEKLSDMMRRIHDDALAQRDQAGVPAAQDGDPGPDAPAE